MAENLYDLLGVDKNASQDEIKKAYRAKSKEHHPDKGGDEEMFKKISHAYESLSDPEKRSNYDRFGDTNNRSNFGFNDDVFNNAFSSFRDHFGFNRRQTKKGENLNVIIKLTLEEIFNGTKKTFKYKRQDKCHDCNGEGGTGVTNCGVCHGTGTRVLAFQTNFGHMQQMVQCDACMGSGKKTEHACNTCNSSGTKTIEDSIELNIPAGITDGATFGMTGKGNAIKGGETGDLHMRIMELPHNKFVRMGNDLRYNLKLSYPQLVLGDKVEIDTIEGTKIRVSIPEYSKVGANLKIQNKGLKHYGNESIRGNLSLILDIDIPTSITDEQREIIQKLKDF